MKYFVCSKFSKHNLIQSYIVSSSMSFSSLSVVSNLAVSRSSRGLSLSPSLSPSWSRRRKFHLISYQDLVYQSWYSPQGETKGFRNFFIFIIGLKYRVMAWKLIWAQYLCMIVHSFELVYFTFPPTWSILNSTQLLHLTFPPTHLLHL